MVLKKTMHRGLKCRYLLVLQAGLPAWDGGSTEEHRGAQRSLGAAGPEAQFLFPFLSNLERILTLSFSHLDVRLEYYTQRSEKTIRKDLENKGRNRH